MNLEELFKNLGKAGAKLLLNKEEKKSEVINLDQISSADILPGVLKRLVSQGEYNKAEDMLFSEWSEDCSGEMYNIAVDFYGLLREKTDEELRRGNFSREEIYQGLKEIEEKMKESKKFRGE
ncbi:MAG: hypothetical protein H6Q58_1894 [Firmicutes bacterium]|nr:hypothetical protein [Bacillota bacterium]